MRRSADLAITLLLRIPACHRVYQMGMGHVMRVWHWLWHWAWQLVVGPVLTVLPF